MGYLWLLLPLVEGIFDPAIYTLQFYRGENTLSYPFLGLGEHNYLTLEFDEVNTGMPEDFWVRIQLCDASWEPSSMPITEYWPAFLSDRITDILPSQGTRIPYVHYRYRLLNHFRRSGLYVIEVLRENDPRQVVLRCRFYVVENLVRIIPDRSQQVITSKRQSVQTVAFSLYPGSLASSMNYQEFQCMLLQNGRWDNARSRLRPTFLQSDHLEYRFQNGLDIPAGVEFRMLDLRSVLRRRSFQIERVLWSDSGIVVKLLPEDPRAGLAYTTTLDLNGRFFIQLREGFADTTRYWLGRDEASATQGEYFWVEFRLRASTPYPYPLYVVGGFMRWYPDPRCLLIYDETRSEYRGKLLLKQGVYDYLYALFSSEGFFQTEPVEGSYFEAENTYTILALYKGITDREVRVVGHRWHNFYQE
ncbi:MAG: DUF5103 domain-containing protein [Bacteroidia bacterium]|nr:DUF5103 domain-containing protein [Bacteroidia bacterium]MDW8236077.1 DUF5103 domain-containing protein [Bacteroidia bacterium]